MNIEKCIDYFPINITRGTRMQMVESRISRFVGNWMAHAQWFQHYNADSMEKRREMNFLLECVLADRSPPPSRVAFISASSSCRVNYT